MMNRTLYIGMVAVLGVSVLSAEASAKKKKKKDKPDQAASCGYVNYQDVWPGEEIGTDTCTVYRLHNVSLVSPETFYLSPSWELVDGEVGDLQLECLSVFYPGEGSYCHVEGMYDETTDRWSTFLYHTNGYLFGSEGEPQVEVIHVMNAATAGMESVTSIAPDVVYNPAACDDALTSC